MANRRSAVRRRVVADAPEGAHRHDGTRAAPARRGGSAMVLRDLVRTFGGTTALDGFSVDIGPGELLALLGPSGCGKTTALRIVAGFETADRGHVLVDGEDVVGVPAHRRDMGMVFQGYSLFPHMSAEDNVAFGLALRRTPTSARRARVAELLALVGLERHARHYPHQLSGGQQQRIALARALAVEPRVLLLDEPLSALDAKVRVALRDEIRSLQRRVGITTVLVTHDQEEALSVADRVCVMRDGRSEQVAAPADVYTRPATPFVAEFVGVMNRLPGRVSGQRVVVGGTAVGFVQAPGAPVPAPGARVDALVRPESLALARVDNGRGIVTSQAFLGATVRVTVLLDGVGDVQVDVARQDAADLPAGASVDVRLLDSSVLVDVPVRAGDAGGPAEGDISRVDGHGTAPTSGEVLSGTS